jgi:HK97 family phage prohead protease
MDKQLIYKSFGDEEKSSVLDVDDKSRRVKNVFNKTGVKDSDNDVIEKTAFNNSISQRGPQGKNLIFHLADHMASLKSTIGKFSELYMEGDNLVGVTIIPKTTLGNDVLELYKTGVINQHSIGFNTVQKETMHQDDPEKRFNIIKEVKLWEGSSVVWGANEWTPSLSVVKSLL